MTVKSLISSIALFLLLMTFPVTAIFGEGETKDSSEKTLIVGPETTLNLATHYLDRIIETTLASLELISLTPEAKQGDWQGIKEYLGHLKSRLPGTYFFVMPDGNYYTYELDYTNLNLKDRPYFESLFAGNEVCGFPIHSRASGKKAALMAVPIMFDGKVTGALGASVYLDDLHAMLNRDFSLPSNYTWFVLDSEGNTMLDRDRDFIFMNPLLQGSPSLQEAVSQALKSDAGQVSYEFGGLRLAHYQKLSRLDWWMFLAQIQFTDVPTTKQQILSLDRFIPQLEKRLKAIEESLTASIGNSPDPVKNEVEIRALLAEILKRNNDVITASFVDVDGILRYIAPSDYRNAENSDINEQEHVVDMLKKPKPLLSTAFTSVEGFMAVSIARPLYDDDNMFAGFLSLLIRPELLFEYLLRESTIPENYELWVMQTDGLILYDQDEEERGLMLFSDPLYADHESLLTLGRKIVSDRTGMGNYIFNAPINGVKTIKTAIWQTVTLHDREWRVVLAYQPYE